MEKKRVVVLMGGPSPEFGASLKSGEAVLEALDPARYEARAVFVDREGSWEIPPEEVAKSADCAVIALHGSYGEDGTVQSLLERHGIPYTGSRTLPSALGMNKFLALQVFADHGIRIPRTLFVAQSEWKVSEGVVAKTAAEYLGYPLIVKPNRSGSRIGVALVKNESELKDALAAVFHSANEALIQEFIKGREFTCGVFDYGWSESAFPLLPTEIVPQFPAPPALVMTPPKGLAEQEVKNIQKVALEVHKRTGASGCSRTDMVMDAKKAVYVLEINTVPGFSRMSLLVKAAEASGVAFPRLLDILIEGAEHHDRAHRARRTA